MFTSGNRSGGDESAAQPPDDHPADRAQTTSSVDGESSPRMPHERDESSDSGTRPPDELMKKAHDDAVSNKSPTDRSTQSNAAYEKLR